ncbi:MAG: salicylate---CoA ligase, partial [Pseudonocardiales bacterium]|nr:salicylate---CoA ligase [Pseudonocardiales bacterium]
MASAIGDGVVPWPAEYAERYVHAGYWAGRTLGELLAEAAERTPDAPALIAPAPNVPAPNVPAPNVPAPNVPAPNVPAPNVPAPNVPAPNVPA